jgi:hypothetical protein
MSSQLAESTRTAVPRTESRSRTWIRPATLLLAAPFLLFTGYAFHPDLPMEPAAALRDLADERTVYLAAKLAVAFGSLLFVPLILLVRHRATPQRGRVLATVAAVFCSVGFACNALSQALWGYLLWFASAPGVDPAAGVAVVEASQDAPFLATLPVSFFSVPLFAVGLLLLAVALWRAGTVPRWVPGLIVLIDLVAPVVAVGPLNLLIGASAVAAFGVALNQSQARRDVGR